MTNRYDPSHPNADWKGIIPPQSSKKHLTALPSQLTSLGVGIGPADHAKTSDWSQGRCITASNDTSTSTLICGAVCEGEPCSWQTEAQSASLNKKTEVNQLTESGRSMHIRGRKSNIPAYENIQPFDESMAARLRLENPYSLNQDKYDESSTRKSKTTGGRNKKNSLIGYRAPNGGASFLSGLGKELASISPCAKHDHNR